MLHEGYKVNLNDPEMAKRIRKALRKAKRDELTDKYAPYALGAEGYFVHQYMAPKVARIKDSLVLRDIENRERKYAKIRARRLRSEGLSEGWKENYDTAKKTAKNIFTQSKAENFAQYVKPAIMKTQKGKEIITKYGPKAQKALDFYAGNQQIIGTHVRKFAKAHPYITAGVGILGGIASKAAADVGSHWLAHKLKMRDPNYAEETRRNAEAYRRRRAGYQFYEGASEVPGATEHSPLSRRIAQKGHQNLAAHKPFHAHVSILRGMAQDKVNVAGLGANKFQARAVNQTNTKKKQQNADIMAVDNLIEDSANFIYEGIIKKALGLAALAGAGYLGYKYGGDIRRHAQTIGDITNEFRTNWKKYQPEREKIWRDAKQTYKDAWAQRRNRARTNMKTEDIINNTADNIYEWAPLVAAAARALPAIARGAVSLAKSPMGRKAGKFVAKETGSALATTGVSKLLSRKRRTEDIISSAADTVYEGWASVAAGALKSDTAKAVYKEAGKAAATAGAQQVGTAVGNRVGQRIERGSYRRQKKIAKQNRRLNRIDRGHRWASCHEPTANLLERKLGGIEEDVAPAARSPFEINRIKNAKDWYHYQRNAYIDAVLQKGKQYAKHKKASKYKRGDIHGNETNESLEEMNPVQLALLGGGAISGALAAKWLWNRRSRKARRKLHAKKANRARAKYNKHAAYVNYIDARKAAEQDLRYSLRQLRQEGLNEMGYLDTGELVKDIHVKPLTKTTRVIADLATKPVQKFTGKRVDYSAPWWQAPKMVKEADERKTGTKDPEYAALLDKIAKARKERKKLKLTPAEQREWDYRWNSAEGRDW
jgi:hypothetical protein